MIHEAGLLKHGAIEPKAEHHDARRRDRPARRGARPRRGDCASDFSQADHLADGRLAARIDVRAYYNVVPMVNPMV